MKSFYFYEIGCILKTIYYIYNVVDYFPRESFRILFEMWQY